MEGFFLNIKNDLVRLIRFYDDDSVLGTTMSLLDFESSKDNLNWSDPKKNNSSWHKGKNTLKRDSISRLTNDSISISFELTSNQISNLYSGYIINSEKIHLTFYNESHDIEQLRFNRFHSETELEIDLKSYQGYLGLMIEFNPNKIFEEFAQQYVIENGKDKLDKLSQIVKNSEEVKKYISHLRWEASKPSSDDLQYIMNTHKYFRWAKEESVCLGALGTILIWSYSGQQEEDDEIVVKIMAKLIDHCSKLKYNQVNNFFHRFYRRLKIIHDSN